MTLCLPLEASSPFPQSPAFLVRSSDPTAQLSKVIKTIVKARRIAVVCGAGISVRAGIPDFRSPDGLFKSLKRENPKEPTLTSGKDLFDISVFNSEHTTAMFCQMIARLSELSQAAQPTPFHDILKRLDDRGRLLRVYTQNIDGLESKSGLSFGVPDFDERRSKNRSLKAKGKAPAIEPDSLVDDSDAHRLPTPPLETPRCIPLHGTLWKLHCQTCNHSFPLEAHVRILATGQPPPCPECTSAEATRQLIGKRSRGVGKLRPSVVLYNEAHKDGEGVGDVVRKDLLGGSKGRATADLLLVVGTSLRVPGTKRIVREFSKAVRSRCQSSSYNGYATPTSTPPRRASPTDEDVETRTIYLNLDFPVPTREWEGVFDVWVKGDAQTFAKMLSEEIEREDQAKLAAVERKRRREQEAAVRKAKEAEEEEAERRRLEKLQSRKGKKRNRTDAPTQQPKSHKKARLATPNSPASPSTSRSRQVGSIASTLARKKSRPTSSSSSASSSAQKKQNTREKDQPRLTIKIPPRQRLVPEVVITTPPVEHIKRNHKFTFMLPPTPSPSPVKVAAKKKKKQTWPQELRSPTRDKRSDLGESTSRLPPPSDEESELTELSEEDASDRDSNLCDTFVRTVQYGLRGSGG